MQLLDIKDCSYFNSAIAMGTIFVGHMIYCQFVLFIVSVVYYNIILYKPWPFNVKYNTSLQYHLV